MMWDCGWVQCERFSYVYRCFGDYKGERCVVVVALVDDIDAINEERLRILQVKKLYRESCPT
jgi:hypothetical protein